jgi:hypothetical protein
MAISKEILKQYGFESEEELEQLPPYIKKLDDNTIAVNTNIGVFELESVDGDTLQKVLNFGAKDTQNMIPMLISRSVKKLNGEDIDLGELTIKQYKGNVFTRLAIAVNYLNGLSDFLIKE